MPPRLGAGLFLISNLEFRISNKSGGGVIQHPRQAIENGTKYTLNHTPRRLPVREYLQKQGRFKHLTEEQIGQLQKEVDDDWARLKMKLS